MKTFKTLIAELFNLPAKWREVRGRIADYQYEFSVDGLEYVVTFTEDQPDTFELVFFLKDNRYKSITGRADVGPKVAFKVFSTVIDVTKDFFEKHDPQEVFFSSDNRTGHSRTELYISLVQAFTSSKYDVSVGGGSIQTEFFITKK
jgi:hypothetical protein